jgi:hypothetical protein
MAFLLLQLPAELRNRIYAYTFYNVRIPFHNTLSHSLSTLFVCRQIHIEATLLPYRQFKFAFESLKDSTHVMSLKSLLTACTEVQRHMIRSLELVTWNGEEMWAEPKGNIHCILWDICKL